MNQVIGPITQHDGPLSVYTTLEYHSIGEMY